MPTYLGKSEADEFSRRSKMTIVAGYDTKHQGNNQESLYLNPTSAEFLDKVYGDEVSRNVTSHGNDEVANRVSH